MQKMSIIEENLIKDKDSSETLNQCKKSEEKEEIFTLAQKIAKIENLIDCFMDEKIVK